jgi:short-subunit dehydrogenase
VLAARRERELEVQAREIRRAGAQALVVPTDVSDPAAVGFLVCEAVASFGRVDILVNNAGAGWMRAFAASPPQRIIDLIEVNLLGAMLLTRAVLPDMLERRHGAIISVGSLSGRVAMEPLYSATKFGLRGFSLSLRRQLQGSGVSASLVSPGNINTAMTRHVTARMPEPELVAGAIADLVLEPRREIVIPTRHHAIASLEALLPAVADRVYRWRRWSPVREEGKAEVPAWTS